MRFHIGVNLKPKKLIKWALLIAFGLLSFIGVYQHKALAYVVLDNTGSQINITTESTTDYSNPQYNVPTTNQNYNSDVWFWSPSLFTAIGDVNGEYLSVIADYNIGFKTFQFQSNMIFYLTSTANTLNAQNLRCGIGSGYQSGYDGTVELPTVTDFSVTVNSYRSEPNYISYTMNIKFNYSQRISPKSINNTNLSCWFVRNPSGGLFAQTASYSFPSNWGYSYQMNNFNFILSNDPISLQLNEVNDKLDNINDTLEQSIENQQNIENAILDESLPELDDRFSDIEISSNSAISDLITMPIILIRSLLNNLGGQCTPYVLPFGLTGGNETLTLPCIHPEEYLGSTIWNYIDLFICLFMVYEIAMLIISSFESITSLEDTFASLYTPRHAKPIGKHTSEVE